MEIGGSFYAAASPEYLSSGFILYLIHTRREMLEKPPKEYKNHSIRPFVLKVNKMGRAGRITSKNADTARKGAENFAKEICDMHFKAGTEDVHPSRGSIILSDKAASREHGLKCG